MTKEDLFEVIRQQAADGADFMTIHCGINRQVLHALVSEGRVMTLSAAAAVLLPAGCCIMIVKILYMNIMMKYWTSARNMM